MFDFAPLSEFSRTHCIGICAFLVPANLIVTSLTLSIVIFKLDRPKLWQSVAGASILALLMIMHVLTWFTIGVVAAPTYILLVLASVCLATNLGAVFYSRTQKTSCKSQTISI